MKDTNSITRLSLSIGDIENLESPEHIIHTIRHHRRQILQPKRQHVIGVNQPRKRLPARKTAILETARPVEDMLLLIHNLAAAARPDNRDEIVRTVNNVPVRKCRDVFLLRDKVGVAVNLNL